MKFNESEYESLVIQYAENNNFHYYSKDEIYIKRKSNFSEVILEDELINFLKKDKRLTSDMIAEVVRKIRDLRGNEIVQANKQFHKYIVEGIKAFDKKQKKFISVELFKKEGNSLIVTNQLEVLSKHPDSKKQKPDVVLYINGLPVIVIELKSPSSTSDDTLLKACTQIKNYQIYLDSLFTYNFFNIISDGNIAKLGSLTSTFSRYQNWRGSNFNAAESTLFKDLLQEKVLINLIKNYAFFSNNKSTQKIIAGYHQYYGVNKALKSIEKAINSDKKGGIFWHTQGAGKSFSMLFLIKNLSQMHPQTTFIIITDRNDLDNQLSSTFKSATNFLGQKVKQFDSISSLKEELTNRKQDGVYLSTIQKFTEDVGKLIERDNVIVITDEAHRSHNNIEGKYEVDLEKNIYFKKFGNAKYLREAFPNATFIGFTGTPIENDDKSTSAIFGKIISSYKMVEAEQDGVIVPINYESRRADLRFDEKELALLDFEDQKINKEINEKSILPNEIKKKINKTIKKLSNFISDPNRIEGIVEDFIKHYESRKDLVKGKAMFVALNRHVALKYYQMILEKKPEWKEKVKLVITTANKQNDSNKLIDIVGNKAYRKKLAIEFKKENSPFKIAIVVDMWLTGFDVPALDTIYLDKPIKMHNLMQTIARTNRVYNNKEEGIIKEAGLVVDYIGLWSKLGEALAFYSGILSRKEIASMHDLPSLKIEYLKYLDSIWKKFNLDKSKIDWLKIVDDGSYKFVVIENLTNKILKNKTENQFVIVTKILNKHIKIIMSLLTETEKMKFYILIAARLRLIKLAMDEIDIHSIKEHMLIKLQNAIKYNNTVVIDKVNMKPIALNDILRFIEIKQENNHELHAREKIAAMRKLIKEIEKINLIRAGKLSSDLNILMQRYLNLHITYEELVKGLLLMKDQIEIIFNNQEEDGLSQEEKAFYEILAKPLFQSDFDSKKIKTILKELLLIINNKELVNQQWMFNQTLIRKTRALLKRLLKKHDYPPEYAVKARESIVSQIMYQKGVK